MASHVLRGAAILGIAAMILGACTPATNQVVSSAHGVQPTQQPPSQPTAKFTFGTNSLTPNVDPALSVSGTVRKYELFETLTYADAKAQLQPMLATKWESVDPLTWRFTLHSDAKFQDGTPVTAKDVEFSWNRAIVPALKAHVPGNMSSVDSITADGDHTVIVKTKYPDPVLLRRFFFLAILPQAALERMGDQAFFAHPIGSGPFKFKEFIPDNSLTLTAWNEHPYRKPKIAELTVKLVAEPAARIAGLRTGDLDAATAIPLDAIEDLKKDGFQSWANNLATSLVIFETWGTNGSDAGPIGNREVRLALNYAIDRDTIAKTIWHGLSKPAKGILSEGVFGYDPTVPGYSYDPAKAKQLLAQAGYPNGFKTQMEFVTSNSEVQNTLLAVQAQLKDIGVEVELMPVDTPTLIDKIYKRKPPAPMLVSGSTPAPLYDGDGQFTFFYTKNRFAKRYSNPEFDAVYEAQVKEMDPAKREALLKQLGRITQDDPPLLLLVSNTSVTVWNKSVNMPAIGGDNTPFFDMVEKH